MVQTDLSIDPTPIQLLAIRNGVELSIKRDDLMDLEVSGNKLFKLKKNVEKFVEDNHDGIITFGGAFSNHIAATAALCKKLNIPCMGIIRGEPTDPLNDTLKRAHERGMLLRFVSRSLYRLKDTEDYLGSLESPFQNPLIIQEGGANLEGILGAKEILDERMDHFDFIVATVGTGTTVAGLSLAAKPHQKVVGIPIHKHEDILLELAESFPSIASAISEIRSEPCHFGGYAKWDEELIAFMRRFFEDHTIKLDPVYTGKAMYKTIELIDAGYFKSGSKVAFIHTGGLQGIDGFESRFGQLYTDS